MSNDKAVQGELSSAVGVRFCRRLRLFSATYPPVAMTLKADSALNCCQDQWL